MGYLLALDEGTTSARAALYNEDAECIGIEANPYPLHYPNDGWVEVDGEVIWAAQISAARRVLDAKGVSAKEILAIGITNQRETTLVWEAATGRPIAPAIVWQCRRTAAFCEELALSPYKRRIEERTGLVIDAYFSASKLRWILDNVPGARERANAGELRFGTVDTWLIWKLTNGRLHLTDVSNASRTMLMDLEQGDWDEELLRIFEIPKSLLPRICSSSEIYGTTAAEHLGAEIPIAGNAGDQQAALFGQTCFQPGLVKNTYGTGCFALMHTGSRRPVSRNRLISTRAAGDRLAGQYALEGSVFVAGAALQFLRDNFGFFSDVRFTNEAAQKVPDTGGVYFVPAFTGLGAPYWEPEARGMIYGLTRSTLRGHVIRAALESIAYQSAELVDAMRADTGEAPKELRADGGAAASDFLLQFQADILDIPVVRPRDIESTALGAAYLAGLGIGHFRSIDELQAFWRIERRFEPAMTASERERLLSSWRDAIGRVLRKH
ncbi:MAG: glycerol kinase GlpK [Bryobacter sp.]